MAWTIKEVIEEIDNVSNLLKVRFGASPMADAKNRNQWEQMASAMCKSLTKKISDLSVNPKAAPALYKAIADASMSDAFKSDLTAAVDSALLTLEPAEKTEASSESLKTQSMDWAFNYLTSNDWFLLQKATTVQEAVTILAKRLKACNVQSCSESLIKLLTAILTHVAIDKGIQPSYEAIYNASCELKAVFHALPKSKPVNIPCPRNYPAKPEDLGPAFLSFAYSADDPPISKELARLSDLVAHHTPVRNTSNLLKANQMSARLRKGASALAIAPTEQSTVTSTASLQNLLSLASRIQDDTIPTPALRDQAPSLFTKEATGSEDAGNALSALPSAAPSSGVLALRDEATADAPVPAAAGTAPGETPPSTKTTVERPPKLPRLSRTAAVSQSEVEVTDKRFSAEDYEQNAFQRIIQTRLRRKTTAAEAAAHKPAGKKASAQLKANAKGEPPSQGEPPNALILGCNRCRGNKNGCSQCLKPGYSGLRFGGREAWKTWYDKQQASKKKSHK